MSELLARIRADIAAAWEHIEAGRGILARSAWLLERWRAQATAGAREFTPRRASVAGDFVVVEAERPPSRRRRTIPHRRAA